MGMLSSRHQLGRTFADSFRDPEQPAAGVGELSGDDAGRPRATSVRPVVFSFFFGALRRVGHAAQGRGTGGGRLDAVSGYMGGVVTVVNIDGVNPGQMKLTGPVTADIYIGKITKGNADLFADSANRLVQASVVDR